MATAVSANDKQNKRNDDLFPTVLLHSLPKMHVWIVKSAQRGTITIFFKMEWKEKENNNRENRVCRIYAVGISIVS